MDEMLVNDRLMAGQRQRQRVMDLLGRSTLPLDTLDMIAEVGSTVHGISAGNDDTDYTVVWTEPQDYLLRMSPNHHTKMIRTQPEGERSGPGDIDLQVYSVRKFVHLAVGGNPSILTPLFTPEARCVYLDPDWPRERIAKMAHTKRAGYAFLGYLDAQLTRWTSHQVRRRVNRPELVAAHGYDTKYAAHAIRLGLQGIEFLNTGRITLPMAEPERTWLVEIRSGDVAEDKALQWCTDVRSSLERTLNASALPISPNEEAVSAFLYDWHF